MNSKRTPKQRQASADNLKKARAAKARGAVPVSSKGRSVPKTKTAKQPPALTGAKLRKAGLIPPPGAFDHYGSKASTDAYFAKHVNK